MTEEKRVLPIGSAELLALLDLEERKELARELKLAPPKRLRDRTFSTTISTFSVTTLLQTILRMRIPLISMLQEVHQFLEQQEIRGRTNVRVVALPEAQGEMQIVFSTALKEAIAVALDPRITSVDIDNLDQQALELKNLIVTRMLSIRGTEEMRETATSEAMREEPETSAFADYFDEQVDVYHPKDIAYVQTYYKELRTFIKKFDTATRNIEDARWLPVLKERKMRRRLQEGIEAVFEKLRAMESERPDTTARKTIDQATWQGLLEKTQLYKEAFFAACAFQKDASSLYDFLHLDIWRQSWRIYELWMLIHLLKLFTHLGFQIDIHERLIGDMWDLKFAKDDRPAALLRRKKLSLAVYYQLYAHDADQGDMPDIAIKKADGTFLLVFDPKYGIKYRRNKLVTVAKRYARSFLPELTVIHNFYPMTSYQYDVLSSIPRCLVTSDVRPHSSTAEKIDQEVFALFPTKWLIIEHSGIFLIDMSGSTSSLRERMVLAVRKEFQDFLNRGIVDSSFILFSDRVIDTIPFSQIQDVAETLKRPLEGGTDLAKGIETAITELSEKEGQGTLLIFTDGEDRLDVLDLCHKLCMAKIHLQIYEAGDTDMSTPLGSLPRNVVVSINEFKGTEIRIISRVEVVPHVPQHVSRSIVTISDNRP